RRFEPDGAAGADLVAPQVHLLELVGADLAQGVARGGTGIAVPQAPGRHGAAALVARGPAPGLEIAHGGALAEAAAELAGAARAFAQRALLDHERRFQLDGLDRRIAHVALADRDGGGFAVLIGAGTPAAALDRLEDGVL